MSGLSIRILKRTSRMGISVLLFILLLFPIIPMFGQTDGEGKAAPYWNTRLLITPHRLPPPPAGFKPKLVDLTGDGKPDIIYSMTRDSIPILWIDDDGDMTWDDLEGDTDSDCLLIDRNRDGQYGGVGDLIIDWVDTNGDNKANMQVVVEYPFVEQEKIWPHGHYMWVLDTDRDNIFNYIDWNTFQLKCWERSGKSDFFEDYSGQSIFMKVHAATNRMEDLRFNWENPFLFYDEDGDGLTEMAIRLVDSPVLFNDTTKEKNQETMKFSGKMDWVSISVDLDNDNGPGNEFDFDFSINFRGEGFDYAHLAHRFNNMRGLPAADTFFVDPRWRQISELVYPDHRQAPELIFKGKWDKVYFVYDEDDDCHRWERVELLDPLDPFKIGTGNGGLDHNVQADVAGDRGEWDMDNSGGGKLYIGKFDGRLHLYGAEWGAWRIDQNAIYYQGWDRKWLNREPSKFATVKYLDTDDNGFIDMILYDLDGNKQFEDSVSLKSLGLDDRCKLIDISGFKYKDYLKLKKRMSGQMWQQARLALKAAEKNGLDLSWYAKLSEASSVREKYHKGYWLQFYIYKDLADLFNRNNNQEMIRKLDRAYYGGNWKDFLKGMKCKINSEYELKTTI